MRMMRCNLVVDASLSEISCVTHFGGEETDVPSTSKNSKLLVLHVKCFLGGIYRKSRRCTKNYENNGSLGDIDGLLIIAHTL